MGNSNRHSSGRVPSGSTVGLAGSRARGGLVMANYKSLIHHPMRGAPVHVFKRVDCHGAGVQFVARLHPYDAYPVFFNGETEDEAVGAAMAFCADAVEKYERAYISRKKAAIKSKATRKANKRVST